MRGKKLIGILIIFVLLVNSFPRITYGAVNKPSLQIVTQPKASYNRGETITFTVNAPNYSGKIEYRVILYNGTTKKTTNLWNTPGTGYFYRKWQPAGTYKFVIKWSATQLEPGAYSLTVLARRANTNGSYDSFVNTKSFYVTGGGSSSAGTISVSDYNEYYNAIRTAVLGKQEKITLYLRNYSSGSYDINKAINEAAKDSFTKSYYVTSYNAEYSYLANITGRTMNLKIAYSSANGYAASYSELVDILRMEASKKTQTVNVKVLSSNMEIANKQFDAIKEANTYLSSENKIINSELSVSGLEGAGVSVYKYTLYYTEQNSTQSNQTQVDVGNQDELEKVIKASILSCDDELQLYFKDIYSNYDASAIFKIVEASIKKTLDEDTDINYIKSYYIQGSELSNTYKITYTFRYPRETALAQYQDAVKKAAEVVNEIVKPDMTQLQREIAIHNYIINNTRYDKYNYDHGTIPEESYTSYGVLVKGTAVCQGYANAMNKLLKLAGVENIIITGKGNGVDHAWNLVKLEDSWYHIDATWDDPLTINDETKDSLSFDYFNLTGAEISKDHTWDITKYPKAIDTKYRYTGN